MKNISKITLVIILATAGMMLGCNGGGNGGNTGDPDIGFNIRPIAIDPIVGIKIQTGGFVEARWTEDIGQATGNVYTIDRVVNPGEFREVSARVAGRWNLKLSRAPIFPNQPQPNLCTTPILREQLSINRGGVEEAQCFSGVPFFTATPDNIDALNAPATMFFSGKGIQNTNGSPALAFYNEFGQIVSATPASNVSFAADGQSNGLTIQTPDLSQVHDGFYVIIISNINPDGSWDAIGTAAVTIYGNPPPPDDGGGGGCESCPPDLQCLPCA